MTAREINGWIAESIIKALPENKKESLRNALIRNSILTSYYGLENLTITVYKEGWYLEFAGCRCGFKVFAYDKDGEFEVAERKPNEAKLNKLYSTWMKTDDAWFRAVA